MQNHGRTLVHFVFKVLVSQATLYMSKWFWGLCKIFSVAYARQQASTSYIKFGMQLNPLVGDYDNDGLASRIANAQTNTVLSMQDERIHG